MNYLYDPDVLYHHGILGMKWGHHKATIKSAIGRTQARGTAKNAKHLHDKAIKQTDKQLSKLSKASKKTYDKYNKTIDKYVNADSDSKSSRYAKKAVKLNNKINSIHQEFEATKTINEYHKSQSKKLSDFLDNSKSGKIKYGKDYIYEYKNNFLGPMTQKVKNVKTGEEYCSVSTTYTMTPLPH